MSINISMTEDGKIKFSMGSEKVRRDDLDKWLGRNSDAILVKLEGKNDWANCKPGHVCRIEEDDDGISYNVFVGPHFIGKLPDEAIAFAKKIESSPEFMISIVGKTDNVDVYVYVAE